MYIFNMFGVASFMVRLTNHKKYSGHKIVFGLFQEKFSQKEVCKVLNEKHVFTVIKVINYKQAT